MKVNAWHGFLLKVHQFGKMLLQETQAIINQKTMEYKVEIWSYTIEQQTSKHTY